MQNQTERSKKLAAADVRRLTIFRADEIGASKLSGINSNRWIESMSAEFSEDVTKFLPLPGGEGRGEGERKSKQCLHLKDIGRLIVFQVNEIRDSLRRLLPGDGTRARQY